MRTSLCTLLALLAVVAGCISTDGLTPEEKREVYRAYLAEAKTYVEEAKPIAQLYVAEGKIKQEEVDAAFLVLEDVAIPLLAAAIEGNDMTAWAQARAKVILGIAKVVILLSFDGDDPTPDAGDGSPAPAVMSSAIPRPPHAPEPPPLPEDL